MTDKFIESPKTTKISPAASIGVVVVGILIASALGGLVVGRMSLNHLRPSGPQKTVEQAPPSAPGLAQGRPLLTSLPALSQLPSGIELTDQAGRRFSIDSFKGKSTLVNFIFTSCPSVCPLMTRTMLGLQKELAQASEYPEMQFLSISVDPAKDTPETLAKYAKSYAISGDKWLFVTGDRAAVTTLIRDGFKLSVIADADGTAPIIHSEQFVLVDSYGIVRGYYNPAETLGRRTLLRDVMALAAASHSTH